MRTAGVDKYSAAESAAEISEWILMLSHSDAVIESAFPPTFFFLENALASEFFICKITAMQYSSKTRHRASTSMHSLTFCVGVMLPECHQWKPAVQTTAVMLRTPPHRRLVTGKPATPTSHIWRAILWTHPVTRQSQASSARTPRPDSHSHYVVISRDGRKLVTRVRVMLP